jgi:hypothetical protein
MLVIKKVGRPKKDPQTVCKIKKSDNKIVNYLASQSKMSVPDFLHTIIPQEKYPEEDFGERINAN